MSDQRKTAADLLAELEKIDDAQITPVDVPEWGVRLWLRIIPAGDGVEMQDAMAGLDAQAVGREMTFVMLALALCAEDGSRLFSSVAEGRAFLAKRQGRVLLRLYEAAARLNGAWKDAQETEPGKA